MNDNLTEFPFKEISHEILNYVYKVHSELGPGLFESVYETCLFYELQKRGFRVERQKPIEICYDGKVFTNAFVADLVIENEIILELKSIEKLQPIHTAQLMTYLRLSELELGYLLNFNVRSMKDGVKRIILS